jgi:hypothetical protein
MLRRLRFLFFVALAAVAGAVAGRIAAEARRRQEAGESPAGLDLSKITIRVQDLVPGAVAAVRVRDTPWSWLHVPSWLAAFAVNFAVAAVGGDFSRLREMAERAVFATAGIDLASILGDRDGPAAREVVDNDEGPFGTGADEAGATDTGAGSARWAAPGPATRADDDRPAGFTPFRD